MFSACLVYLIIYIKNVWILVYLTGKIFNNRIKNLKFNPRLYLKSMGILT